MEMDLINVMKELMLETFRIRQQTERERARDEREWKQQNNTPGADQGRLDEAPSSCSNDYSSLPNRAALQPSPGLDPQLNRCVGQMSRELGSLSTVDDRSLPPRYCDHHQFARALDAYPSTQVKQMADATSSSPQRSLRPPVPPRRSNSSPSATTPTTTSPTTPSPTLHKPPAPAPRLGNIINNNNNIINNTNNIINNNNNNNNNGDDNASGITGNVWVTSQERSDLLQTIQRLAEEQESIKAKMEAHEEHLRTLSRNHPKLQRRLSSNINKIVATSGKFSTGNNYVNKVQMDDTAIYAQFEQLYVNLCRISFPADQMASPRLVSNLTKTDDEADLYSVPSGPSEILLQEIQALKEKVKYLESCRRESSYVHSQDSSASPGDALIDSLKLSHGDSGDATYENTTTDTGHACPRTRLHPNPCQPLDVQQISSTFEWTIDQYYERLEREQSGRMTHTVSEPFYISQFGYRVCLDAYLNGNRQSRCMSLFLRVVKGDFDDLLQWPMSFNLTFFVVNQDETEKGSVRFGSRDNPLNSIPYGQPEEEHNDLTHSWGMIQFIGHDVINSRSFVKNGAVKIRVKIKTLNQDVEDSEDLYENVSIECNNEVTMA